MFRNISNKIKLILVVFFVLHQFQYDAMHAKDSALFIQDTLSRHDAIGIAVIDNLLAKLISIEDMRVLEAILDKYPTTVVTKDTMSIENAAGPSFGMIYLQKDDNRYVLRYVVNSDCSMVYFHNEETVSAWLENREFGKFRVMSIAEDDREILTSVLLGRGSTISQHGHFENLSHAIINKYRKAPGSYIEKLSESEIVLVAGQSEFKIIQRDDIVRLSAIIKKYPISNIGFREHDFSRDKFLFQYSRRNALTLFSHLHDDFYYPFVAINPIARTILWTLENDESGEKYHTESTIIYKTTIGIPRADFNKIMSILKISPTLSEVFGD